MAEIWLLVFQIAMLAFVISTGTAGIIWLVRIILKKVSVSRKGDDV